MTQPTEDRCTTCESSGWPVRTGRTVRSSGTSLENLSAASDVVAWTLTQWRCVLPAWQDRVFLLRHFNPKLINELTIKWSESGKACEVYDASGELVYVVYESSTGHG